MDSGIRSCLQHPEESLRRLHIPSDLRAKEFGGIEPPFIANALQKLKPHPFDGWGNRHIQHERLDGLRGSIERWTCSNVGDGVHEDIGIHGGPRDVDTRARHKFVIGFEIQSRNRHVASPSLAGSDAPFNFKPPAQHPTGARDPAFLNALSNVGAADNDATRRDRDDLLEFKLMTPALKCFPGSGLPVAKNEIASNAKEPRMQAVNQIVLDEGIG